MKHYLNQYTDRFTEFSNKSISDLILYSSGIEYCEPNHYFGLRNRDYHVIHFVKEGKGILFIEGKEYAISANQLFIIPSGYSFHYKADSTDPWKYSWIGFLGIKSNFIYQAAVKNQFVFNCQNAQIYENIIDDILKVSKTSLGSFFKINGLLYTLIGKLIEEIGILDYSTSQSISTLAIHYMNLHYHEPIQMREIAEFVGIHPGYFSSIFKLEQGITPKQYLINLKLTKSKELLLQTNDPINIIASSVGFSDALAFSKFFKKSTNLSPREYRKEKNNDN
ncbi:AraC family transcriptional regulator [Streptococcus equinus]|uniref:AraC family transcriptional regulator n=1 Tax=Streptococcus equinus TaxID=1335 RepID=UPI003BF84CF5